MITEWNVPFTLQTPEGDISLSGDTGYKFDKDGCDAGAEIRAVRQNIPQGDGAILGHNWAEGYLIRLRIQFWEDEQTIACDTALREMADELDLHLWALRNPATGGRLLWTPSGAPTRFFDELKIFERPVVTFGEVGQTIVEFTLASRHPYALDYTQITTNITSGNTVPLVNTGTSNMWPLFKVYGSTGNFLIENDRVNYWFNYDSSRPGAVAIAGGDYAEISNFNNTIFLNGDQVNLKPGIVIEQSDFMDILPGTNNFSILGADMDVLWQAAWA